MMDIKEFSILLKRKRQERFNKCSDNVKGIISNFNKLSDKEKRDVLSFIYEPDVPMMKNPYYKLDDIKKMHKELYNMIMGWLIDNNYENINALYFNIDGINIKNKDFGDTCLHLEHWSSDKGREIIGISI